MPGARGTAPPGCAAVKRTACPFRTGSGSAGREHGGFPPSHLFRAFLGLDSSTMDGILEPFPGGASSFLDLGDLNEADFLNNVVSGSGGGGQATFVRQSLRGFFFLGGWWICYWPRQEEGKGSCMAEGSQVFAEMLLDLSAATSC